MLEPENFTLSDLPEWFLKRPNSIQEIRLLQTTAGILSYHFKHRYVVVGCDYTMYSFDNDDDLYAYCTHAGRLPIFIYDQEDKVYMRAILKLEAKEKNLT